MKRLILVVLALWVPATAGADADVERANLAKLSAEIEFLIRRVDEIKRHPSDSQRWVFDYESLKSDLRKIRNGVDTYIDRSIQDGRNITPLKGHYHQPR